MELDGYSCTCDESEAYDCVAFDFKCTPTTAAGEEITGSYDRCNGRASSYDEDSPLYILNQDFLEQIEYDSDCIADHMGSPGERPFGVDPSVSASGGSSGDSETSSDSKPGVVAVIVVVCVLVPLAVVAGVLHWMRQRNAEPLAVEKAGTELSLEADGSTLSKAMESMQPHGETGFDETETSDYPEVSLEE